MLFGKKPQTAGCSFGDLSESGYGYVELLVAEACPFNKRISARRQDIGWLCMTLTAHAKLETVHDVQTPHSFAVITLADFYLLVMRSCRRPLRPQPSD